MQNTDCDGNRGEFCEGERYRSTEHAAAGVVLRRVLNKNRSDLPPFKAKEENWS
ncbi:MAG: hypothetical protein GF344_00960 [Chitinivibrionales bacterium]|nr:hypothetical protein [Chitinivibrionales bacterium]MBD3355675.1 hypothetical protein [Chitinivibrionales bacterium]